MICSLIKHPLKWFTLKLKLTIRTASAISTSSWLKREVTTFTMMQTHKENAATGFSPIYIIQNLFSTRREMDITKKKQVLQNCVAACVTLEGSNLSNLTFQVLTVKWLSRAALSRAKQDTKHSLLMEMWYYKSILGLLEQRLCYYIAKIFSEESYI